MNIEQFQIRIGQREGKIVKRSKLGKMNRFGEAAEKQRKRERQNNKREWLYREDEE